LNVGQVKTQADLVSLHASWQGRELKKRAIQRGSLDPVLSEWLPDPLPLNAVYPQRRHLSGKVRVFLDWIAALFKEHDGIQLRSSVHFAGG
jgi:LysR family transcriptional regulator for bpeEF and oprC